MKTEYASKDQRTGAVKSQIPGGENLDRPFLHRGGNEKKDAPLLLDKQAKKYND